MGSFGNMLEDEVLDHVFGKATYTAASPLYIALSTADPTEDCSGLTEPGSNYARKSVTNNKTTWTTSSGGALANAIEIAFVTATGDWGTISHFAIMNHASASAESNMLAHGALDVSKAVGNGDTAKFAIGDLDITLT